ncbi:hypothetical protein CEY12_20375 [Chryseobacterium sp. T16E-39]|nr:hypothetical protein CEY12_20375 [Chryseobacterium sp. T16E-39]
MFLGQNKNNPTDKIRLIQKAGSARSLEGKALQVNIFISLDKNKTWSRKGKEQVLQILPESETWLKRELGLYGHTMDIRNKNFGIDRDIILKSNPDVDAKDYGWPNEAIKQMGYNSLIDFYDDLKSKNDFDQMYIVFFINGQGQPYANPCDISFKEGDEDDSFVEYAAIFSSFDEVPITDKSQHYLVPHEILHLFGALDLYESEHQTKKTEEFAVDHLTESVMLGSIRFVEEDSQQWNLKKYKIDEFNAYIMRLHNNYKSWYDTLSKKLARTYD